MRNIDKQRNKGSDDDDLRCFISYTWAEIYASVPLQVLTHLNLIYLPKTNQVYA